VKLHNTLTELNVSISNMAEHAENWFGSTDPA